jgi:hypothetical protein
MIARVLSYVCRLNFDSERKDNPTAEPGNAIIPVFLFSMSTVYQWFIAIELF